MKTFGKIEDEVVTFFKRLNYPFQVRGGGGATQRLGCRRGGHGETEDIPPEPSGCGNRGEQGEGR